MTFVQYHEEETVHIFRFLKNNRNAVDLYMNQVGAILTQMAALEERPKVLRVMIDITQSGMFPLQYALSKARSTLGSAVYIPQVYYAYITSDIRDISIIKSLDYYSPSPKARDTRHIFSAGQLQNAKEWLNTKTE